MDSEAGWLAVVGERGEGAGDVCSCTLPSPVKEVMTVHWSIPTEFPAGLPAHIFILGFYAFCGTCTHLRTSMAYTYVWHGSLQMYYGPKVTNVLKCFQIMSLCSQCH